MTDEHEAGGRQSALRGLAAVDEVLREPAAQGAAGAPTRASSWSNAVRAVLDRLRREILRAAWTTAAP